MTTADTGAGLLRAVVREPLEDTVRLAYADWLDERGAEGDAARAEFIRVQIRIAELQRECSCTGCARLRGGGQGTNGPCAVDRERIELPDGRSRQAFLRRRERELLDEHWGDWIRSGGMVPPDYRLSTDGDTFHVWRDNPFDDGFRFLFRRGFVSEVRCRLDCGGTGRTPGVAADLFANHPVTRVVAVDKEPYLSPEAGYVWVRDCEDTRLHTDRPRLPHEVFANLPGASHGNYVVCEPNSVEGGQQMLSRALVAVCRTRAGLPELPRC